MILDGLPDKEIENILARTPCYLMSESRLRLTIQQIRKLCGKDVRICYSVKSNPWMTAYVASYVDQVEVCSEGELIICEKARVKSSHILAGGVYKDQSYLEHIIKKKMGYVSVESILQMQDIQNECKKREYRCKCLLRLSSGNQFGLSDAEIIDVLINKKAYPNLMFVGIHYYSGTQKKKVEDILGEMKNLEFLLERIGNLLDNDRIVLEYGPGIGFSYFTKEQENIHMIILEQIVDLLVRWSVRYHLVLELGRICVAGAGEYISKIIDIKENDKKKYYILDGGHHQINYYGQSYGFRIPRYSIIHSGEASINKEKVTVCGSLCTSSDVFMRDLDMNVCEVGDYIVFHNVGAYSTTEGTALFLSRTYPNIFFLDKELHIQHLFKSRLLL